MSLEIQKETILQEISKFITLQEQQKQQLQDYVLLLLKQNQNYNFIGKSTIPDIWNRHILDCAQLIKYFDDTHKKTADLGSGAGLPGIILSILGVEEMHLIEKSFRKSQFLHEAKVISPNKIFIHATKLEEITNNKFDIITSRALAPLDKLLNFSINLLNDGGYLIFLKGKNLQNEISKANQHFKFDYELHPSLTSNQSNIIKINNIKKL